MLDCALQATIVQQTRRTTDNTLSVLQHRVKWSSV